MKKSLSCILLVATLLTGCAGWSKVEQPGFTAQDRSYTVELPVEWVRFLQGRSENDIFITYDGPNVERIEINKRDKKEAFPKIKKSANDNMLALELADLTLAELRSVEAMANVKVIANTPVTISGQPGFKLELMNKNDKGVEIGVVVYGLVGKNGFYTLTYQAPHGHYFNKYSATFEKVVSSFKLI